jgi:F0F1-type ATP synthase membrane subunit b/b'
MKLQIAMAIVFALLAVSSAYFAGKEAGDYRAEYQKSIDDALAVAQKWKDNSDRFEKAFHEMETAYKGMEQAANRNAATAESLIELVKARQ